MKVPLEDFTSLIYICFGDVGRTPKGQRSTPSLAFWCWAHLAALFPDLCVLSRKNFGVKVAIFLSGDSLGVSLATNFDADSAREEDVFWDK